MDILSKTGENQKNDIETLLQMSTGLRKSQAGFHDLWLVNCWTLTVSHWSRTSLKPTQSPRGRVLSATILVMVTLCMPFLQGLDFNDWLWIGVMLNITVLRNEVSWRNCFNGLDKYIDLRKDFRCNFYSWPDNHFSLLQFLNSKISLFKIFLDNHNK